MNRSLCANIGLKENKDIVAIVLLMEMLMDFVQIIQKKVLVSYSNDLYLFYSLGLDELRRIEMNSRIRYECHEILTKLLNTICSNEEEEVNLHQLDQKKRKRERNKRISAPKRMANPFR